MTLEPVTLDITEDALEELITTYVRHTVTATGGPTSRSLRRYRDGIAHDTAQADRIACWLRLVSIVEIYAESVLLRLSNGLPGGKLNGWDSTKKLLKQSHGVDVESVDGAKKMEACFVVRNSVAHGLGRFTAHQLAKELPRTIRILGVAVRDGEIAVTPEALRTCVSICQSFVNALDAQAQVQP